MLKLLVSGILGSDAEVKDVAGKKLVKFPIAVNKDYKDADGTKVEKTDWLDALMWRNTNQSVKVAEYLKKGKRVLIEGDPSVDSYLGKDGKAKGRLSIRVKNLEFIQ